MSDPTTILVDARVEHDDAAAAAMALYLRLVGDGTIGPHLFGAGEPRFRVHDAALRERGVLALGLHASGHRWVADDEGAHLVDGGPENGIFSPYNGSFRIRCPDCREVLAPGEDGSESLEEALAVWCEAPNSAYVVCPSCASWTPLVDWRSPSHDFAVGHFAITLYGAHLRGLAGGHDHADTVLRHRLGDLASDFVLVFARA
ncbi:hypothetical protein KCV01_g6785, partial [Aureobasidium melanogenum]